MEPIQLKGPRHAIDDEQFAHADSCIKIEFLTTAIVRTDDLDEKIRPAAPMCSAVFRRASFENDGDIRAPVILCPVVIAIADVDSGNGNSRLARTECDLNNGGESCCQNLMLDIG